MKKDFINTLAETTGESKKTVETVLNAALRQIKNELSAGKQVQFIGFGSFQVQHREKHKGRNPQTGEEIEIPASNKVKFVAGSELKSAVN
jgi:DNA-binding protein HU-beta